MATNLTLDHQTRKGRSPQAPPVDWHTMTCPPVVKILRPLRVSVGEQWCAHCGAVIDRQAVSQWNAHDAHERNRIQCCAQPAPVLVRDVLRTGEYVEVGQYV